MDYYLCVTCFLVAVLGNNSIGYHNTIVNQFADGDDGEQQGVKYVYESFQYKVIADMASGYLRIYDKILKDYIDLNGKPGSRDNTHFKILRREEM